VKNGSAPPNDGIHFACEFVMLFSLVTALLLVLWILGDENVCITHEFIVGK